jgi:tripartite-type tricarboxylate transporter receptor subunit TctC
VRQSIRLFTSSETKAGGATDAVMRAIAESAGKTLGGQFVVENKAGASGMLGPNELVRSPPDGYTLSQLTIGIARLPHMQKMQFDPLKDFTYVLNMTGYTFGLVVKADSPIRSVKDLVDYAKANPGTFTYGSPGQGTTPHLAVEEFADKAGIKLQHVPFKGFAEGMQSMLGGHAGSLATAANWRRRWTPPGRCNPVADLRPLKTPYSTTRACTRNAAGMARPSAAAVLRLMTSSNSLDCSTGS